MSDVLAVILGGGKGTRLYPLTKYRSKPAVPLAGKYRLIDIPISNCLNSNVSRIFVLTQYNSASLNRHINLSYHFDTFRRDGFVDIIAAEQTPTSSDWFRGTADAIRKTLNHYASYQFSYYLILSGDHIYSMNYQNMIKYHRRAKADISVAAIPVPREKVSGLGILNIDEKGFVRRFIEKPTDQSLIDSLEIGDEYWKLCHESPQPGMFLANMAVYLFNRSVLEEMLLSGSELDFGAEIFPRAVEEKKRIRAHLFRGYWEDIGTIRSFYQANLGLVEQVPKFSFYDEGNRVYTHARFLPPSKINKARTEQAILSEGCIVDDATIINSLIGLRSIVRKNTTLVSTVLMGADYYESLENQKKNRRKHIPDVGIGAGSYIEKALIDKNARIGKHVRIVGGDKPDQEGENWFLRDGIVVIEKNGIIPDGTELNFS